MVLVWLTERSRMKDKSVLVKEKQSNRSISSSLRKTLDLQIPSHIIPWEVRVEVATGIIKTLATTVDIIVTRKNGVIPNGPVAHPVTLVGTLTRNTASVSRGLPSVSDYDDNRRSSLHNMSQGQKCYAKSWATKCTEPRFSKPKLFSFRHHG